MIRFFLAAYAFATRTGFLRTRLGEATLDHAYFAYKRYVEDPFGALAHRHPELFHGGDVLDVGANIGYTASVFARVLTPGFQVYALEPEQKNWERLEHNVRRLGLSGRITPVRVAAGDHIGTVEFWRNPANHADSRVVTESLSQARPDLTGLQSVELITLDRFVQQRSSTAPIRFVKIDVQHYELAVLRGAETLLQSNEITLATEIARADPQEPGSEPEGILDFLSARSFLPHTIDHRGRIMSSDRARIAEIAERRGYTDVSWSRRRLEP